MIVSIAVSTFKMAPRLPLTVPDRQAGRSTPSHCSSLERRLVVFPSIASVTSPAPLIVTLFVPT